MSSILSRERQAELNEWPLPAGLDDHALQSVAGQS
jgi:hypothetical protein